jgi:hypothetical protein
MKRIDEDPERGAAWESLAREQAPPPELEARVVRRLAARGLLRRRSVARWLVPLAATLAGVAGGWLLRGGPRPAVTSSHGDAGLYLLLVSADPPDGTASAERVELYRRWARGLAADGRLESARKLTADGVRLDGADGPATPVELGVDTPTGFFLVRAPSLEAAVELARASPHARLGGRVTVRPIDPV